MKVLLAGATGLVGGHLLDYLLSNDEITQIHAIGRRDIRIENHKFVSHVVDFDKLSGDESYFNVDTVFCCLGTTIKKAGSKQAFKKVDLEYPLKLARLTQNAGASCFSIITAIGSDPDSRFFYNRVKGNVEYELKNMKFERLHIHRPAGIMGERKENRPGESFFNGLLGALSFVLFGPLRKIRPVEAKMIAKVMLDKTLDPEKGLRIVSSTEYQKP